MIMRAFTVFIVLVSVRCMGADEFIFTSGNERVSLVELFTSEGCSSCPPADSWLSGLCEDAGLWKRFVPVAFHVDYWDGLGWKDRWASPEFSTRQRTYAAAWRSGSVYTPGVDLNGQESRSRRTSIPQSTSSKPGRL